ncbi:sensor histidine kinase [bacterium]|nr:sensor histidine kinase [bacterium]
MISILLVIGFLITSLASYFAASTLLRSEIIDNQLPLTSDNIYSEIQRDLLQPILISSLMAHDTFLKDWVLAGEKQPEQVIKYLNEIKTRYNTFTSFFVSEKSRIYYQAKGILKTVHSDESRDKWYFRVSDMKTDFEINVDIDMANADALTIFINYRVFDYEGRYIGAAGVGLNVYAVKKIIETYQERYQRRIFFIDKQGKIMLQGTLKSPYGSNIKDIPGLNHHLAKVTRSDKSIFKYENQGVTHHVNSRYIPEFNWILIVEQAEGKPLRSILNTLVINLLISLVTTIFVLVLIYYSIRAYQKRLEKMAAADKQINVRLQSEIAERKKGEEQIKSSLKEKEVLLQEIHHRVKNNMAVISSLLELQMAGIEDPKGKDALRDSQNRVHTMSMIHDTLCQSDNLSAIDAKTYLTELGSTILQSYTVSRSVSLKIDVASILISVKQASPLGLIVNELLTNALKYAFPNNRQGEILLAFRRDKENEAVLTISDNGVGLPGGLELQRSNSLGLRLVKVIAENQLLGAIEMGNRNGTAFTITFKLDKI